MTQHTDHTNGVTRSAISARLDALVADAGFRAVRGAELAIAGHVRHVEGSLYAVASGTAADRFYEVDLYRHSCTCPDLWAQQGWKGCKHHCAALLVASASTQLS